jgi:hypothetical protein
VGSDRQPALYVTPAEFEEDPTWLKGTSFHGLFKSMYHLHAVEKWWTDYRPFFVVGEMPEFPSEAFIYALFGFPPPEHSAPTLTGAIAIALWRRSKIIASAQVKALRLIEPGHKLWDEKRDVRLIELQNIRQALEEILLNLDIARRASDDNVLSDYRNGWDNRRSYIDQ